MTSPDKKDREVVIEVTDLVTYFGDRRILNNVNLTVHQGEIMVIMGGSGSGKSTLLRHILGLHQPAQGGVTILDKDVNQCSSEERLALFRNIGMSFQGGALFSSMTVGENIKLPLREHTKLDEATMDIMCRMKLEMVNLAGFEDLMPSQLSGGMIKRAALARAIIMDPRILCFDEPSAGLDPVVAAELDELIIKLRDVMNMAIIVVTHELDSAFAIADRITVLDQGAILLTDSVKGVKASDNERVQDLLNRRPREINIDADEYLGRLTGE